MDQAKVMKWSKRFCGYIKMLRKVIVVGIIVVIAVLGAITVANAINPSAVIGEGFNNIEVGPLTFEVAEEFAPDNGAVLVYAWIYGALGAVAGILLYMALGFVRSILVPMTEGLPFHEDAAKNIRRLGWMSLALGTVKNIGGFVESTFALTHFGIDNLVGGAVKHVTVNYSIDLSCVVVFLILLLLSYVFAYGAQLQKLSDETL